MAESCRSLGFGYNDCFSPKSNYQEIREQGQLMGDWGSARLKAMIEIGSAIAVLVGLIFVGVELRQNTAAVEAATFQSLTDASSDWLMTVAGDPELLRAWTIGSTDPEKLDEADSARYFLVSRSFWVRMQNVFSQWERGTLGDEDWQFYDEVLCGTIGQTGPSTGNMATFDRHKNVLSDRFLQYLENCWDQ